MQERNATRLAWRDGFLVAAILLVTAATFARALAGELVYDDQLLIARNPLITDLANVPRLFTHGYWDFQDPRMAAFIGYWRPLTSIVHALVWPLAGSRTAPYHAVSLAVHLAATVAAFLLARRLLGNRLLGNSWSAGAVALLFALHPVQVESVAWISALNDPLAVCLGLFALLGFLRWRARGSRGIPLAAATLFALSLLAKEVALAFVPLVVLLDVLVAPGAGTEPPPLEPGFRGRVRGALALFRMPPAPLAAYAPFAAVLAAWVVARMAVFASPWAGFDRVSTDVVAGAARLWQLRVELFGGALELLAWPARLAAFRPLRPAIEPFDPALVRAALCTLAYLALLGASLLSRRRRAALAGLIVAAGLVPVLVQVRSLGPFPLADRYLYLPVLGFALGATLCLARFLPGKLAAVAVVIVAAAYAARSHARIPAWHDEASLYRDAAEQAPRSIAVQIGLGRALLARLEGTHDARSLVEAHEAFERAAALLEDAKQGAKDVVGTSRDYLQVNLGLAHCAIESGDDSAAILMLEELARRIEEIQGREREARARGLEVPEQFLDLARVYTTLAVAQTHGGRPEDAERSFARALELEPDSAEAHANRGRIRARQERWAEAVADFEATVRLRPGVAEDRLQLAQALEMNGDSARAEVLARALIEEMPDRAEPLLVLAAGTLKRGNTAEGLTWLERALALDPRNAVAWYQKACALLQRGDAPGALDAFRKSVERDPENFAAHHDCGGFLLAQGLIAEAEPYLVRAYVLAPPQHRANLRRTLEQLELADTATLRELADADAGRDEVEAALAWFERALAREPANREVLFERARLLRRAGRDEEALAAFRTVSETSPNDFEVWSELGAFLDSLGRKDEARPALEHALELEPPAAWPKELRESSVQRVKTLLGQ